MGQPDISTLIVEVFRLNGCLLAAGDRLVADMGLTSARWQVLGAIALNGGPITVPSIARNMGLTRQAVQRVVNDLQAVGLLRSALNPHHRRASLIALTDTGASAYAEASQRQIPWAASFAAGCTPLEIARVADVLRTLREGLERTQSQEDA